MASPATAAPTPAAVGLPGAHDAGEPSLRKVSLAQSYQLEEPLPETVNAAFLHPLSKCVWPSTNSGSAAQAASTDDVPVDAENSRHLQLREWLGTQANWAARLLTSLLKGDTALGEENKLKPAVLNSCNALAFTNVSRGGFGVSYASGYGFVIKKRAQDQWGNSNWGSPLFFNVSQSGLGLTAGYQHSQSVVAVLAEGSLEAFKTGTTSLGSDLGFFSTDGALTGLASGVAMGATQHMGMTVDNERAAFCYCKVDGVHLEVSAHRSAITPDVSCNKELYGEGYVADEVLNTSDTYRHEMLPLLRLINQMGKLAMRS